MRLPPVRSRVACPDLPTQEARRAPRCTPLLHGPKLMDAGRALCRGPPRDTPMANKMLIDATHPEETRVVVLRGNRVEEFDFESAHRKQLRGNIYLAKVTRVEPSLQAAFVDYGGNRHGFLAFSEIHPDYYQIPVSDRQELLEEDARAHREEEEDGRKRSRRHRRGERAEKRRGPEDEKLADTQPADLEPAPPEPQDAQVAQVAEAEAVLEDTLGAIASPGEPDEGRPDELAGETEAPEMPRTETAAETSEAGEPEPLDAAPEAAQEIAGAAQSEHERHRLATDPEGFAVVEGEEPVSIESEFETRLREKPVEEKPAEDGED